MEAHEKQNFSGMFVLSGLIIALMLAMSAAVWLQLPPGAEIPVHWNALGQVDRYGGKFEGRLVFCPNHTVFATAQPRPIYPPSRGVLRPPNRP